MGEKTFYIKGNDGFELFTRRYSDDRQNIKGVVHILHGMSEHSGRYEDFAHYLAASGYVVYSHDHRCHGKSLRDFEGLGVFTKEDSFDRIVDDALSVMDEIRSREATDSIITLGHSMGSVILRGVLQRRPQSLSCAIIMGSVPFYPKLMITSMRAMAFFSGLKHDDDAKNYALARKINRSNIKDIETQGKNDWISTDANVVKAYEADPLSGFVYTTWFYRHFFAFIEEVSKTHNIDRSANVPMLFISGDKDPLSKNMRAIKQMKTYYIGRIPGLKAEMLTVEGARHEVLNEMNKKVTYKRIVQWIKSSQEGDD